MLFSEGVLVPLSHFQSDHVERPKSTSMTMDLFHGVDDMNI